MVSDSGGAEPLTKGAIAVQKMPSEMVSAAKSGDLLVPDGTVTLAEVVTARGGRGLSEEEGWALLCASVQVPVCSMIENYQK